MLVPLLLHLSFQHTNSWEIIGEVLCFIFIRFIMFCEKHQVALSQKRWQHATRTSYSYPLSLLVFQHTQLSSNSFLPLS